MQLTHYLRLPLLLPTEPRNFQQMQTECENTHAPPAAAGLTHFPSLSLLQFSTDAKRENCTELRKSPCTWFSEVCSCCCLSPLPLFAYNILATTYEDFFSALYSASALAKCSPGPGASMYYVHSCADPLLLTLLSEILHCKVS